LHCCRFVFARKENPSWDFQAYHGGVFFVANRTAVIVFVVRKLLQRDFFVVLYLVGVLSLKEYSQSRFDLKSVQDFVHVFCFFETFPRSDLLRNLPSDGISSFPVDVLVIVAKGTQELTEFFLESLDSAGFKLCNGEERDYCREAKEVY
jgi:hypothetical protein